MVLRQHLIKQHIYYRNPYQNRKGAKIQNIFFQIDVEKIFLRVGKKLDIHIDQKFYALSISAVFRAIGALLEAPETHLFLFPQNAQNMVVTSHIALRWWMRSRG